MVWVNDSEFTHASVCIVNRDEHGYITNLIRILDYHRDINGNESYAWAYRNDGYARRTNPEDPKTLYRKETLEALHGSGEDFLFVRWKPNTDNPERPLLRDPYSHLQDYVPKFYEVLNSPANNIDELRKQLEAGWKYSGTPTQKVLVVYSGSKDNFDAVLLDRDDLDCSDKRIRLKITAPLGAQWFTLKGKDIEYLPGISFDDDYERTIYTKPFLPQPRGTILIQSLSRYALQYMRWYVDHVHSVENEAEWNNIVSALYNAFQSPEHLDEFGIRLSSIDVQRLQKTVSRFINDDYQMFPLVQNVLAKDPAFKRACIDACRQETLNDLSEKLAQKREQFDAEIKSKQKEFDQYIQRQNDEVHRLEARVRSRSESYDNLTNLIQPLQAKVDDINRQFNEKKSALDQLQQREDTLLKEIKQRKEDELEQLNQQRQAVLKQLDGDVALKLGLRSVAESVLSAQSAVKTNNTNNASFPVQTIQAVDYSSLPATQVQADFAHAVAINLQSFGVTSIKDYSGTPIALATACSRIASVAKLIAVDSTFATPLASAMSYAASGKPAKHVSAHADWHDAASLDRVLTDKDANMLVLDGPIDTVNENLLFALSRLEHNATIILPIGAYGNLRLIAGEIWDHVFYLPTEQYIKLPVSPHRMLRSKKAPEIIIPDTKATLSALTRLQAKSADGTTHASLVLPAAVATQFSTTEEGDSWISAHLALRTFAELGMAPAQAASSGNKAAAMLLTRIERGHHAR